jgi:hypothetical protein
MTLSRMFEDLEACLRMVRAMSCVCAFVSMSCPAGVCVCVLPDCAICTYPAAPPLPHQVCQSLQTGDGERVGESCAVLREISVVADFPRPEVRDRAALAVLQYITSSAGLLAPFFSPDGGDERVAHEICNSLVSLASHEAPLVASPQHCSVEFFQLLLSCTQQRPRRIASLTFDVWISLADIPVVERHAYVSGEVFQVLLHNLLASIAYPADFSSSWDESADDEDDLSEFRDNKHGIQDVLLVCAYALDATFFEILEKQIVGATAVVNGAVVVQDCWRLEAVLYVLHQAMEAVKSSVNSKDKCGTALSFLVRTVQLLLAEGVQGACALHPELQDTVCVLLGALTFLLTSGSKRLEPEQPGNAEKAAIGAHFVSALSFLFKCLPHLSCCGSAAKAVHQLCIHGQKALTAPAAEGVGGEPLVFALVEATIKALDSSLGQCAVRDDVDKTLAALLQVIKGVVRTLTALPLPAVGLFTFAVHIERCLGEELAAPTSAVRVELLLKHAAQVRDKRAAGLMRCPCAVSCAVRLLALLTPPTPWLSPGAPAGSALRRHGRGFQRDAHPGPLPNALVAAAEAAGGHITLQRQRHRHVRAAGPVRQDAHLRRCVPAACVSATYVSV